MCKKNYKNPLVSVIIPSYNHGEFIEECIKSIILQSYNNIELIIIDDCSKDNSVQIIVSLEQELKNRFINYKFIQNKINKGICETANIGIEIAKGDYYQFVSSDDLILKDFISKQVSYLLDNPQYICAYSDGFEATSESISKSDYSNSIKFSDNLEFKEGNLRKFMLINAFNIPSPTFIYKKELTSQVGEYDSSLDFEDIDMFLRISREHQIGCQKEALYIHRRHTNNTGRNIEVLQRGLKKIIKKYKNDAIYSEKELDILNTYLTSHFNKISMQSNSLEFWENKKYKNVIGDRKLILWGTGSFAEKLLNYPDRDEIEFIVSSFVDVLFFANYKVLDANEIANKSESYFVFIASSFKEEIKKTLELYGYKYEKDFY